MQRSRKIQIVARLMVEELAFFGVRNPSDLATCLAGYDTTTYPRDSDCSFTGAYLPKAVKAGYRLAEDAARLWDAFAHLHHQHGLPGALEIPMESLARAVEITLKEGEAFDRTGQAPSEALWRTAVRNCGYIQARQAVGEVLAIDTA